MKKVDNILHTEFCLIFEIINFIYYFSTGLLFPRKYWGPERSVH